MAKTNWKKWSEISHVVLAICAIAGLIFAVWKFAYLNLETNVKSSKSAEVGHVQNVKNTVKLSQ